MSSGPNTYARCFEDVFELKQIPKINYYNYDHPFFSLCRYAAEAFEAKDPSFEISAF